MRAPAFTTGSGPLRDAGARRRAADLPPWVAVVLAALAGVLQVASFAPWELWALQPLSLALLVALIARARPAAAALRGWAFGTGWLLAGLWWIDISLHRYGHLPSWLSVLCVVLLAGLLALYYALAAALWAAGRRGSVLADALRFAAWWLLAELARGRFFTGFPWIAGGYAHTTGPFADWAPRIGVYGIGALSAWVAAALALGALALIGRRPSLRGALGPALLSMAVVAAGDLLPHDFTRSTGVLRVTLLQSNVPQDLKFDEAHVRAALVWHLQRLGEASGQLVVTPESSLPLTADQVPTDLWAAYERPFRMPGRGALVGVFTGNDEVGYTNSLVGLDATHHMSDGSAYVYGKRHLLPFGEFIPPGFHWLIAMMHIPLGDQARGHETAPFVVAGQRVRPLVCYEDLFGEDFADSMVGPQAATLLANVSNLAWFGSFMVQDQHLQFSRMRALEFQRGQMRSTNTGATAVIDYRGRITARLPPDVEGRLDATIEGRVGDTPYARWLARWGLGPLWIAAAAVLLAARLRSAAPTRRR